MLFIEWPDIFVQLALFSVCYISIMLFRSVGKLRSAHRLPVQILCTPIFLLSGLLFVGLFFSSGCTSFSLPVYSPSRTSAARVGINDGGAFGGNGFVEVYSHRGLTTAIVFTNESYGLKPENLEWLSDSHLVIRYDPTDRIYRCDSTRAVKVECLPKQ